MAASDGAPHRRSRNPFPCLANPLAAEWEQIAIETVDRCDDLSEIDPVQMQWARCAFFLGAQAALHVIGRGAKRRDVILEICLELDKDDEA